jgi:tRNA nucleotidyltransferase (CCA-adding enzyme)
MINKIETQILEKITPTKEYRLKLESTIKNIKLQLGKEIRERNLPASIELVGSTAKDTYLKNDLDIDFFLKFPANIPKEEIAKNTLLIGKKILKETEESYAEHPYIRGFFDKYNVEIVPCYKIENAKQKLSAVDRTPLHTKFVIENLGESQKSDVRLLKQFLKGIKCYGAESEIEGFSGYLCEILIIKYKSFKNLLIDSKNWKKGKKISLKKEKSPDFDTPLIFIDPVDIKRNVASALSIEKFRLFIKASSLYIKKPSKNFFFPNKIEPWSLSKIINVLNEQNFLFIGIKIDKPDIIPENLYPQVRKASRSIYEASNREGFKVHEVDFHIDEMEKKIYFIIKTEKGELSKSFVHIGPPKKLKTHSKEFLKKWQDDSRIIKEPYLKDDRYFVEIKREFIDIVDFLSKEIKNLSMGKHLDKIVNKNSEILAVKDLLIENLKSFWTEYLDKKMPWER